jgi:hypothetical protein
LPDHEHGGGKIKRAAEISGPDTSLVAVAFGRREKIAIDVAIAVRREDAGIASIQRIHIGQVIDDARMGVTLALAEYSVEYNRSASGSI